MHQNKNRGVNGGDPMTPSDILICLIMIGAILGLVLLINFGIH